MRNYAPSIFESFNARSLKPSQVAKTFVPSQQFKALAKRNHTIVIGPRGSGKTTLLKMLQQPALESWDHRLAEEYRATIDFTGVFVATDLTWGTQISALGEGELDEKTHKVLSISAFTTHILKSLVTAMTHRISTVKPNVSPFRRTEMSDTTEAFLVKHISELWRILPQIPSLRSLKQALSIRLSHIREIANAERLRSFETRHDRIANEKFLHLDFIESVGGAVECFNELVHDDGGKWALLFDELELAPDWIRDNLIISLRSRNPHILLKLALSPFSPSATHLEMKTGLSPSPDQDFEQIALWYAEKNSSYRFCFNLWESMLMERGIIDRPPATVLGESMFATEQNTRFHEGAYAPNSKISQRFVRLAKVDHTFRRFLEGKNINPSDLSAVPNEIRDSIVRKIAPLVVLREFFRSGDSETPFQRSRKSASLYAGADSLFAISEGNPRWFIAIIGRLLDNWQNTDKSIQRGAQASVMGKASQRFAAMLRTIPAPYEGGLQNDLGVLSLLEKIGEYFHRICVTADFVAEPPTTFVVDENVKSEVLLLLEQALNAGAIVLIPDEKRRKNQLLLTSLMGHRFRISYLLAPTFGLPIRLGIATSLSRILASPVGSVDSATLPFYE